MEAKNVATGNKAVPIVTAGPAHIAKPVSVRNQAHNNDIRGNQSASFTLKSKNGASPTANLKEENKQIPASGAGRYFDLIENSTGQKHA